MSQQVDIVIVGAGLVGTSLALALQPLGLRVVVLEKHLPTAVAEPPPEARPLTLAYGSQRILDTLGVWPALQNDALAIDTVHVSEQSRFGSLVFRAGEMGLPALGYVVPYALLAQTLYQQAAANRAIEFVTIQSLTDIDAHQDGALLRVQTVQGQRTFEASLVVGADGAHSDVRRCLSISTKQHDPQQSALVLHVTCRDAHHAKAFERFTDQGVVAMLPLADGTSMRCVWTVPHSQVRLLQQASKAELTAKLQALMSSHLRLASVKWLQTIPLGQSVAATQTAPHAVLIGNAAHTVYPIAAQGFNLGLRDAAHLAEVVATSPGDGDLGGAKFLAAYVQRREADQTNVIRLTQQTSQLFDLQVPMLGQLRAAGLMLMDMLPPLKKRLARQMLGLSGKLPRLARGLVLERADASPV